MPNPWSLQKTGTLARSYLQNSFLRHLRPKSTPKNYPEKARLRLPALERAGSFQVHHQDGQGGGGDPGDAGRLSQGPGPHLLQFFPDFPGEPRHPVIVKVRRDAFALPLGEFLGRLFLALDVAVILVPGFPAAPPRQAAPVVLPRPGGTGWEDPVGGASPGSRRGWGLLWARCPGPQAPG